MIQTKKAQTETMLSIMIVGIIGLVILGVVYTFLNENSISRLSIYNESLTMTAGAGNLANDKGVVCTEIHNLSYIYAIGTEANCSTQGAVQIVNSSTGIYNVTYSYEPDAYISSSTARNIAGYIPVIFVLLIFASIAGYLIYK